MARRGDKVVLFRRKAGGVELDRKQVLALDHDENRRRNEGEVQERSPIEDVDPEVMACYKADLRTETSDLGKSVYGSMDECGPVVVQYAYVRGRVSVKELADCLWWSAEVSRPALKSLVGSRSSRRLFSRSFRGRMMFRRSDCNFRVKRGWAPHRVCNRGPL